MDWTVEALCVLVAGVLFLLIVLAGLSPFASLTTASFVAFGVAGVVFIVAAFALARVQDVNYPPLMWVLPILPLLVIGVLCKDAVSARRATGQPEHATAIARPTDEWPLAVPQPAPPGLIEQQRDGEGSAHELLASGVATPNDLARVAINFPELRPQVARNPLTPDSVLQWLAQQGDAEVLEALRQRAQVSTV